MVESNWKQSNLWRHLKLLEKNRFNETAWWASCEWNSGNLGRWELGPGALCGVFGNFSNSFTAFTHTEWKQYENTPWHALFSQFSCQNGTKTEFQTSDRIQDETEITISKSVLWSNRSDMRREIDEREHRVDSGTATFRLEWSSHFTILRWHEHDHCLHQPGPVTRCNDYQSGFPWSEMIYFDGNEDPTHPQLMRTTNHRPLLWSSCPN